MGPGASVPLTTILPAMPHRPLPASPLTFDQLVIAVRRTVLTAERQIARAAVHADWETGRLINVHYRHHQARATYAEGVIPRLARRTGIHERTLYYCARFNRLVPILNARSELTPTHYRALCQVEDDSRRQELLATAEAKKWTTDQLAERVRTLRLERGLAGRDDATEPRASDGAAKAGAPWRALAARHGTPGLYPVIARRDTHALDLGFKMYLALAPAELRRLQVVAGDIVRVDAQGGLARARDAARTDLFAYRARDVRVIDGDTLAVTIELPPHNEIDKKLRLRGLNAPEIDTGRGRAARRFVADLVAGARGVWLTTTKPDKYDRYLADVFLQQPSGPDVYLNNALLEDGHASRSDGRCPADWVA